MKSILKLEIFPGKIVYLNCLLEEVSLADEIFNPPNAPLVEIKIKKEKESHSRNMDKIDIFDAAIFIVTLHYRANKLYACNRTKIEKLLAIADLIAIKAGKRLFPQYPIFINSCGIGYCVLAKDPVRFPMDNIIDGIEPSLRSYTSDGPLIELQEVAFIPEMYSRAVLPEKQRKLLEDVFCKFGAYSAKLIGSTMDEFKDYIKSSEMHSPNSKYTVDEQKAKIFFMSNDQILETNFIAKYINEYQYEL